MKLHPIIRFSRRATWTIILVTTCVAVPVAASRSSSSSGAKLQSLDYREFPRRSVEEAAVLEWGYSAIITALDASIAHFGPQSYDAALFEVEAAPMLASPLDGSRRSHKRQLKENDVPLPILPLDNAADIEGNLCVMTNNANLTGVQMAMIAQMSGAAALLIINADASRPDDIYRLSAKPSPFVKESTTATSGESSSEDAETPPPPRLINPSEIEIPVVMISLNSANILATANLDPESPEAQSARLSNKYMPDRVRLYAGDDRPFFEDVEAKQPTMYLIHDLLKPAECDALIQRAKSLVSPITTAHDLTYVDEVAKYRKIDRVVLWQGLLSSVALQWKQIEDRIEQVTSFPSAHYSDFVVDRFESGSLIQPTFDNFHAGYPAASMTIFLSEMPEGASGAEIVYPTMDEPVKIHPRRGLAVVHHNNNERGEFDVAALHAILPYVGDGPFYVAHKYVFMDPLPHSRRLILPLLALPTGGQLPSWVVQLYDLFVEKMGYSQGVEWFDRALIFVPVLILLLLGQFIFDRIHGQLKQSNNNSKAKKE